MAYGGRVAARTAAVLEPEEDRAYGGHEQEAEVEAVSTAVVAVAAAMLVVVAVVGAVVVDVVVAKNSSQGPTYRSSTRLTGKESQRMIKRSRRRKKSN
jgi:transcriptional regulator of nitric oxide reductase